MSQFVDNSARGMSLSDYDDECFKAGPCPIVNHMRHSGPISQAHHRRMMNAIRGSSPEPFDLAVRLKSFDSDAAEPCPQLAGDSGGRWVVRSGEAGKRAPVLSLGLAACDQEMGSTSPRVKVIPQVSRKLVLESRDKEMLLEQVLDLKRSLFDQQIHLRHYKIQASMLDMENRHFAAAAAATAAELYSCLAPCMNTIHGDQSILFLFICSFLVLRLSLWAALQENDQIYILFCCLSFLAV
ncbi:unnamed protein product [Calypogeia fissa]